MSSFEILLYM